MPHLLVRVTGPQRTKLRNYWREGRNHKGAIEAAVRGAHVYLPSYGAIPPSKALASALIFQEQTGRPFEKARNWVTKVNNFATQYLPELESITKIDHPPTQDIMETLEEDGPPIGEYVNSFHRSVSDRVGAIDYLFNHPTPGTGPAGGTPRDAGPTPTRPLIGPGGEQLPQIDDAVEVVEPSPEQPVPGVPSVPSKAGTDQPATTVARASVELGEGLQTATLLNVFIASPGDLAKERKTVEEVIQEWNRQQQYSERKVILIPRMWEEDAIPVVGEGLDGQAVINEQLVDQADIVFALFYSRLGSATPRHISGSAEEVERSIRRGIPVHVYRAKEDPPEGHDRRQYEELGKYLADLEGRGLIGSFRSHRDLRKKVMAALLRDVRQLLRDSRVAGAVTPSITTRSVGQSVDPPGKARS